MARILEAETVIKARDRTGGTFDAVANKMRRMTAAAEHANRRVAAASRYGATIDRHNSAMLAGSMRFLGPAALAFGGAAGIRRFADTEYALPIMAKTL